MYKHATRRKHRHHDYDLLADLDRIKNAITNAAYEAKGRAGDMITQSLTNVKEKSEDLTEGLGNYAKKRPVRTLGIAVLTGAVIGFLITRRMD